MGTVRCWGPDVGWYRPPGVLPWEVLVPLEAITEAPSTAQVPDGPVTYLPNLQVEETAHRQGGLWEGCGQPPTCIPRLAADTGPVAGGGGAAGHKELSCSRPGPLERGLGV